MENIEKSTKNTPKPRFPKVLGTKGGGLMYRLLMCTIQLLKSFVWVYTFRVKILKMMGTDINHYHVDQKKKYPPYKWIWNNEETSQNIGHFRKDNFFDLFGK